MVNETKIVVPRLPPFYYMPWCLPDVQLSNEAYLFMDQMWQSLNIVVNSYNYGITVPSNTTAEIAVFGANVDVPNGVIWFNTTTSKLNVKTAPGVIEQITSV